jgi:predicted NUDIX family NTP pyrophosphohydrolase
MTPSPKIAVRSAGILLWRRTGRENSSGQLEVFIAHMGGPFWARKDAAAWSIPKGEFEEPEAPLDAARREFAEEVGVAAPELAYAHLGDFRQSSGKIVIAFAAESSLEVETVRSNTFALEWPPHSGRIEKFPEIDDARWVPIDDARIKLVKGQLGLLDALETLVS